MKSNNLPDISFSQNWNGKLLNDTFPSFRLPNAEKYKVGNMYNLKLKGEPLGRVELVKIQPVRFSKISDTVALIDVGHPAQYLKSVLMRMYQSKNLDWTNVTFWWLFFKHLDHEKAKDNLIQQRSEKLGIQADLFQPHRTGVHRGN